MKSEEIVINKTGLTVLGFPVGFKPTARDFDLALEGEVIRSNSTATQGRELRICDAKGLTWLVNMDHGAALWLDVRLAPLRYRNMSEADPSDCFKGKIHIGQYTVQGPFSFETGEIVRKVEIVGLSLSLLPDEKRIRAVTIAFQENK